MEQYKVAFEYSDAMSGWKWRGQEHYVWARSPYEARKKCIELYGLGYDCEYRIVSVEVVPDLVKDGNDEQGRL